MKPKQIVQKWVDTFNKGDANELAEYYANGAINHQIIQDPIEGKEAIRKMLEGEFSHVEMICIIENIFEDGDWAILEWKDLPGLRGCGFCQVHEGKFFYNEGIGINCRF